MVRLCAEAFATVKTDRRQRQNYPRRYPVTSDPAQANFITMRVDLQDPNTQKNETPKLPQEVVAFFCIDAVKC